MENIYRYIVDDIIHYILDIDVDGYYIDDSRFNKYIMSIYSDVKYDVQYNLLKKICKRIYEITSDNNLRVLYQGKYYLSYYDDDVYWFKTNV